MYIRVKDLEKKSRFSLSSIAFLMAQGEKLASPRTRKQSFRGNHRLCDVTAHSCGSVIIKQVFSMFLVTRCR